MGCGKGRRLLFDGDDLARVIEAVKCSSSSSRDPQPEPPLLRLWARQGERQADRTVPPNVGSPRGSTPSARAGRGPRGRGARTAWWRCRRGRTGRPDLRRRHRQLRRGQVARRLHARLPRPAEGGQDRRQGAGRRHPGRHPQGRAPAAPRLCRRHQGPQRHRPGGGGPAFRLP